MRVNEDVRYSIGRTGDFGRGKARDVVRGGSVFFVFGMILEGLLVVVGAHRFEITSIYQACLIE